MYFLWIIKSERMDTAAKQEKIVRQFKKCFEKMWNYDTDLICVQVSGTPFNDISSFAILKSLGFKKYHYHEIKVNMEGLAHCIMYNSGFKKELDDRDGNVWVYDCVLGKHYEDGIASD